MKHQSNFLSDYSQYFISNINYHNDQVGIIDNARKTLVAAWNFIHNTEAVRKISALISIEKPQIAHLHNIYHQITPAIIPVLKKAGIKIILTLHDYKLLCPAYYMLSNENICNECAGKNFYRAILNRCQEGSLSKSILLSVEAYWHKFFKNYEMVDLFLAPSQFMADIMAKHRIDKEKIFVLHNGIDTTKYKPSNIDNNYILYLGRISKVKGVETLLKAYKDIRVNIPLKIVGTATDIDKLKYQYPDVEFTGYKTGNELGELIEGASFSVMPSEWYENCSMSVLESMAYGKPVIGSNIGGIPEQIVDGKSGFLFEPGNISELAEKMSRLIENITLRHNMGKASRKIIEQKYSLAKHCNGLINIYKEILNR